MNNFTVRIESKDVTIASSSKMTAILTAIRLQKDGHKVVVYNGDMTVDNVIFQTMDQGFHDALELKMNQFGCTCVNMQMLQLKAKLRSQFRIQKLIQPKFLEQVCLLD